VSCPEIGCHKIVNSKRKKVKEVVIDYFHQNNKNKFKGLKLTQLLLSYSSFVGGHSTNPPTDFTTSVAGVLKCCCVLTVPVRETLTLAAALRYQKKILDLKLIPPGYQKKFPD